MLTMIAVLGCALPAQQQPQLPGRGPDSGLILAQTNPTDWAQLELGGGGIAATVGEGGLQVADLGSCRTPGGVEIQCRLQGVHFAFPSGARLLFAPDGHLHRRDGAVAGPFPGGVAMRLGDGVVVKILHGPSRRAPIEDVTAAIGDDAVRLWDGRRARKDRVTSRPWVGGRLWCLGEGDAVYRPLSLGPLLTLEQVFPPTRRQLGYPARRLVLAADAFEDSIRELIALQGGDSAAATGRLRSFLARCPSLLSAPRMLPRISSSPLQFLLGGGYQLRFELDRSSLRLQLLSQGTTRFAEWRLGYDASVRCVEATRPVGRSARVGAVGGAVAARSESHDLPRAVAVVEAMQRR